MLDNLPKAVIDAIYKRFPDDAIQILQEIAYDNMNGCYFFTRWGMYIGIEEDGYIHT